jgi:hypothetical protein
MQDILNYLLLAFVYLHHHLNHPKSEDRGLSFTSNLDQIELKKEGGETFGRSPVIEGLP